MTIIEEKLRHAGYPIARDKLYTLAVDCLQKRQLNAKSAAALMRLTLLREPSLIEELAQFYLQRAIVPDMTSRGDTSGGQVAHVQSDQLECAADKSSFTSGQGHGSRAYAATMLMPPARDPQAQRRAAVLARTVGVTAVLDSLRVRDGRAIGDVKWSELPALTKANTREAEILRRVRAHYADVADPSMRVRDLLKEADIALIVQQVDYVNVE